MIKELLHAYSNFLRDLVSTEYKGSRLINPRELNKTKFRARAVFLSWVFYSHFESSIDKSPSFFEVKNWLKSEFKSSVLFSILDSVTSQEVVIIEGSLKIFPFEARVNISDLYEMLLGIETSDEGNSTNVRNAKNYRNKLGSYYTPHELAIIVTRKTIDEYFRLNLGIESLSSIQEEYLSIDTKNKILDTLTTTKFADFSCGGGVFLYEVADYFGVLLEKMKLPHNEFNNKLRGILLNIYGFDVDPLALEVTRFTLYFKALGVVGYQEIFANFVHANFLISSDNIVSEQEKIDVFSEGFIYHEKLSRNTNGINDFDVIVGNPPWEKIRFEEKSFYTLYSSIASQNHFKLIPKKSLATELEQNVFLSDFVEEYKQQILFAKNAIKKSDFFKSSNAGELNTYALFTESAYNLISERGVIGLVLKSAIVTSQVNKVLFKQLVSSSQIIAIYDFINTMKIFDIDSRERFCFLLIGKNTDQNFFYSTNLKSPEDIEDASKGFYLDNSVLAILNPVTCMLPNFSNSVEAKFILRLAKGFPYFNQEFSDVKFGRIVHLTNHSDYISKSNSNIVIPIYEGKFFNQFDSKYSGFQGVAEKDKYGGKSSSSIIQEALKLKRHYVPESRFYIAKDKWKQLSKNYDAKYMLAWRSLTSATNSRTCISTILPFIPASQSVQFLTCKESILPFLVSLFNSIVFDYVIKKKLSGIDLTQSILNQMPVPPLKRLETKVRLCGKKAPVIFHINNLVAFLYKNDSRLDGLFSKSSDYNFPSSNKDAVIYIDTIFLFLYEVSESEFVLIKDTFKKQYSDSDFSRMTILLKELSTQNSISSTSSVSTSSPVT